MALELALKPVSGMLAQDRACRRHDSKRPSDRLPPPSSRSRGFRGARAAPLLLLAGAFLAGLAQQAQAQTPEITITRQTTGIGGAQAATATEGSTIRFTISSTSTLSAPLRINLSRRGGAAFGISDQAAGTLRLMPPGTSTNIGYDTTNDVVDEADSDFTVTILSGTGYTVGSSSSATVTIEDNDVLPGAPSISSVTGVGEQLTVEWSAPSDPGYSDGTAASHTNNRVTAYDVRYILTSATDKSDGQWTVVDDAWTTSGHREYTIPSLTLGSSYDVQVRAETQAGVGPWSATSVGAPVQFPTVTITRRQVHPAQAATVTEGDHINFTFHVSPAVSARLNINLQRSGGAAFGLSDATRTLDTNPPGLSHYHFTYDSTDDDNDVADADLTVTVLAGTGYTVGTPASATVTIQDNDGAPGSTPADTTAPALSMATPPSVNGTRLTLVYDEPLDSFSRPTADAFTVRVGGVERALAAVNPVRIATSEVWLTLASAVAAGETVTVSYTAPTANPLQDGAGNDAGNLSNQAVINATPGVRLSASRLILDEGGSGDYAVWLAAQPTGRVTVTITSSNADVRVDTDGITDGLQNRLTFTVDNWGTAQTVTVRANEDADTATDSATLTHAISEASPIAAPYASLAALTLSVTVNDNDMANRAPAFASDTATRSLPENTAAGTDIGEALAATDADAGDTLTYSLGGLDAASFDIVGTSGQLRTKSGVTYDFETKPSYTVTVEVSDGTDTDVITVTIGLTDVGPPAAPYAPTFGDSTSTSVVVNWLAPANTGPAITDYDVQYREGTSGGWTAHPHDGTGRTTTLTGLTPARSYQVQVRAISGEGRGGWSASGTATASANNAPAFSAASYGFTLVENEDGSTNAVDIGQVSAADPDGHTVSYEIAAGDDGGVFAIASDGAITYTGGGEDHETTPSFPLIVRATDTQNGSADVEVTVTVTDANEPPAFDTEGLTLTPTGTVLFSVASDTTAVGTVTAADPDAADTTVTYVLGGTDGALFSISASGVIAFLAEPDFENPQGGASDDSNEYTFSVDASAGAGPRAMSTTLNVKVTVTDATAPTLSSAAVNGATLVLTYNEALDEDSVPARDRFTVDVDGSEVSLATRNAVAVSGRTVTLTLASAVAHGAAVTVSYTAPATNPIRDTDGNVAANLSDRAVTNTTPDTTAPVLSAATIDGATLTLTYDEALDEDSVPARSAFTVEAAGSPVRVANVAVDGGKVKLRLASAVEPGDTVTVSYTTPATDPIRDPAGHAAANLSNRAVTNATGDTAAPALRSATVTDAMLVLRYDEALDESSVPATSAFDVLVAGARVRVGNVAVDGRAVRLTLASAAAHGDTVSVSYFAPSANPIRDRAGNAAARVGNRLAANDTPARGDTTAPALRSATVTDATLVLAYDEGLDQDSAPAASAFTVRVAGSGVTVTNVAVDGGKVKLTLASAAAHGETVTVSYAPPSANPIRDPAGNAAASLSSRAVTNDTPAPGDTTAPALSSATITDDRVVLTYDEPLDTNSVPGASAFRVRTGGSTARVEDNVAVAGSAVTLTLRPSSMSCGAATVSYGVPGSNPIQDTSGNRAGGLSDRAVRSAPNTPGITVTAPSPSPLPEGGSATFTVKLDAMPCGMVNISLGSDNPDVVAPHHSLLSFAAVTGRGRWNRPQAVTAYSRQDHDAADETATFTLRVRDESPAEYRALADVTVTVEVADDDTAALSVADARVKEASGATLDFAVTLDRARHVPVTVDYATSDGSAKAGEDYTAVSGTLTFAAGETAAKTVRVTVLDDAHDEGEETLSLKLSNPQGAVLGDGEATGTIENADLMPAALLARLGRATAEQVVTHIEERMAASRQPGFRARFAGQELRPGSERDFALGILSSFAPMRTGPAGAVPMGTGSHVPGAGMPGMGGPGAGGMTGATSMAGQEPMGFGPVGGAHETGSFGTMAGHDPLSSSEFELNRESRGGILSVWSRSSRSHFSGLEDALSLNGDVRTTMVGGDYSRGALTLGLGVGRTLGLGGYSGPRGGRMSTSMTGFYPWVSYRVNDRVSVWGTAGYGAGGLSLTPDGAGELETGVSMMMTAAGTRGELVGSRATRGFSLAFKADALRVGAASALLDGPKGRLNASEAGVTRVRTALEGSRGFTLGGGRLLLKPSVEVGLRRDGGDAETGAGMDVGGGLAVTDAVTGLSLDVRVRRLVAHQAEGFAERGMSVSFGWDPTPSSPLGLSAKVAPSWGGTATGGAEALWGGQMAHGMGSRRMYGSGGQFDAEVGYGLPVGARLVGTPRVGLRRSPYGRDYQAGYALGVLEQGKVNFELGVEAQRRVSPMAGGTGNGVLGRATLRW